MTTRREVIALYSMIPRSGHRFAEKIMLKQEARAKTESA
jgi:hypothetical protein